MNWRKHTRILPALAIGAIALAGCGDDNGTNPVTAPTAPTNVEVQVNGTSATVSWTPGANATGQTVTVSDVANVLPDEVEVLNNNTTSSVQFENLSPATYTAVVTASNTAGSANSAAETFTIADEEPTSVVVSGVLSADETWTADKTWIDKLPPPGSEPALEKEAAAPAPAAAKGGDK